jgi:hypothetical protein
MSVARLKLAKLLEEYVYEQIQAERARILAALERLSHHGTWQDGTAAFWRADEVRKVVAGDEGD